MATGRYADYFNHSDTSDVKVVIEVAQNDENLARKQLQLGANVGQSANVRELHAHSVILMGNSPVWKAQLERWQDAVKQRTVTLIVEEGEQAAAYELLQFLYTDCLPDIETEVDLRMNLGMLMLADQYHVKAALSACAQKLGTLTNLGAISWELADRVMQLPAAYLEKPGFSSLLVKIQEKILKHVAAEPSPPGSGLDLEVVMRNSILEEGLMALPLRKCATLLSDDRCRVASENTVAAAVVRRVNREGLRAVVGDEEHVQSAELRAEIMGNVIRVPHLSPLFAAAMPTVASQLTTVVRPEVYAVGRELERFPAALREKLKTDPSIPSCWLSGPRPPSVVTAIDFDWEASIAELAAKFDSGTRVLAVAPKQFFAGRDWTFYWAAIPSPDDDGRKVAFCISCQYPLLADGPRYGGTVSVNILAPDKTSLHAEALCSALAGVGWGWLNFFNIPPMQKWDQNRMQKWTTSNGFLTVHVKVSDVL